MEMLVYFRGKHLFLTFFVIRDFGNPGTSQKIWNRTNHYVLQTHVDNECLV